MRLLFLTACYAPPLEGGSVVYLYNIISHLPPADVAVYTNARERQEDFDRSQPYRIFRSRRLWDDFGKAAQFGMVIEWFFALTRILAKNRQVALIHAGEIYPSGLMAWTLGRLFDKPYVVYTYAEELTQQMRRTDRFWGRLKGGIYSRVIRGAAAVVTISDYTSGLVRSYGIPPERIVKILPTLALSKGGREPAVEAVREKIHLKGGDRLIVSVGRLIERKGHDFLIRSMPAILAAVPEARLVIAGRGPNLSALHALAEGNGLAGRVDFLGAVDEAELSALYELCEVFALTHREVRDSGDTEGFGMVFIEAGAHGKPVVGGLAGGVRDAVLDGQTGLLVDGENPHSIAGAIVRLLCNPELAERLGEAGRRRAMVDLSPDLAAEKVMDLSNTLLGGKA